MRGRIRIRGRLRLKFGTVSLAFYGARPLPFAILRRLGLRMQLGGVAGGGKHQPQTTNRQ